MGNWTLETISWDRFDASKVDPEILRNIKAAALVERNGERLRQSISAASSPTMRLSWNR